MIKLISFDLDGTLIKGNSWLMLNKNFGMTDERDYELYMQFINKEISYQQWLDLLFIEWKLHHNSTITKQELDEAIMYELIPGAFDAIQELRKKDITVIVSGALDLVAHKVARELNIEEGHVLATNRAQFDEGDNLLQLVDVIDETQNGKLILLENFCKEKGIEMNEVMHVGDGLYDIPIFNACGNGVTFDWCKEEVKQAATFVIKEFSELPGLL